MYAETTQPAGVLATWLEELFAKRLSGHAMRIFELVRTMRPVVVEPDATALRASLESCQAMTEMLDLGALEPPPWYHLATGKAQRARQAWQDASGELKVMLKPVHGMAQAFQAEAKVAGKTLVRTAVELDLELQALDKLLPQAWSWQEQLWRDVRSRRPAAGDMAAQQKVRWLLDRCDRFAEQLRQLDEVSSTGAQVVETAHKLTAARHRLTDKALALGATKLPLWRNAIEVLDIHVQEGTVSRLAIKATTERQLDVLHALEEGAAVAGEVTGHQEVLREFLALLRETLST